MKLLADIGGTNTRCTLMDRKGDFDNTQVFKNREFEKMEDVLEAYLQNQAASLKLQGAALSIAAPIHSDNIRMTNLGWNMTRNSLQKVLKTKNLKLVNDFGAIALSLPELSQEQLYKCGGIETKPNSTKAVLGPGTGLGVASIVYSEAEGWMSNVGEGGHVTLAPTNDLEDQIITKLRKQYGHVSGERVICGVGLALLYETIMDLHFQEKVTVEPEAVQRLAQEGDRTAKQTIEVFFSFLGNVAGNLALTLGATGGVYIAGGISIALKQEFLNSSFRDQFESKGRFESYLKPIPTFLIEEPIPAFWGLKTLF